MSDDAGPSLDLPQPGPAPAWTCPSLDLIARQLQLVLADVGSFRDDICALAAIAVRQGHTLSALLAEVRAFAPTQTTASDSQG